MKKNVMLLATMGVVAALTGCGAENSAVNESGQAGSVVETDDSGDSNTDIQEDEKAAAEPAVNGKQEMNPAEFEQLLSTLPMTVDSVEYVVQSEEYKSLYPDSLQVLITNHTTEDIKDAVIAFVAWDESSLPVKIKGQYDLNDGSYVKEATYSDINLTPEATFGDNYGYQIDESCGIDSFRAIIKSFETFNGEAWTNPYYESWKKLYEGNKYSDSLTTMVELSDKAAFKSSKQGEENANAEVDEKTVTAAIEEQEFRVIETNYVVQSDKYKSLYPDMLQAILENDTELDIKSAVVAFVAWDANNLPVKIEGEYDYSGGAYVKEVNYDDINMVPGATFGEGKGYSLDENNTISNVKAIVVSYEAYDGTTWKNPEYAEWKKLYEGVKISN